MTKIPSISSIFEKILKENDNNGYSDDALLYQDILQYSIIKQKESRDEGFTLWEITNWLIKNNIEFVEYYNQIDKRTMNTSNKIRARIDRVEAKVKDLETLRLIDFIQKESYTNWRFYFILSQFRFWKHTSLVN